MEENKKIRIVKAELYILPVTLRIPLKFGDQVLQSVSCARVKIIVENSKGKQAEGWGETPLSAAWVWPSKLEYNIREKRLVEICKSIGDAYCQLNIEGHPFELGQKFIKNHVKNLKYEHNQLYDKDEELPYLGALVAFSPYDLAVYDAYAKMNDCGVFETLGPNYLNADLSQIFHDQAFSGKFISDYLEPPQTQLPVWHLVGGLDALDRDELDGKEPDDGYPITLEDWILNDGLKCLKIKLTGTNWDWDYDRIKKVFNIGNKFGVKYYSTDFNCTVEDTSYVNSMLDALQRELTDSYDRLLYVEQPFPYDLEKYKIDVTSVARRKPIYLDESAHDWNFVKLGHSMGWNGVALKTCKTLTGALLSLCWAKNNNMEIMVQDLTNPMLAQISHVLLAAHSGTIMGVESNSMQFYPEASLQESSVHPGIYNRTNGILSLESIGRTGFGYRVDEINRDLPDAVQVFN